MKILTFLVPLLLVALSSLPYPLQASIDPRAEEVVTYWFGPIKSPDEYPEAKATMWFMRNEEVDHEIRSRFEPLVIMASKGKLDSWRNSPKERLALLILLDQFPRNIYRNDPRAFSFDLLAQQIAIEGIEKKDDLQLLPIQRVFFYLPFEHAENIPLQKLSIQKFTELRNSAPKSLQAKYEGYLDYAIQHYEMIKKFGRFPYRNEVLKRKSTPQELIFLEDPDASF